jgi:hypothetical protein
MPVVCFIYCGCGQCCTKLFFFFNIILARHALGKKILTCVLSSISCTYTQKESFLCSYIHVRTLAVFGGLDLVMIFGMHSLRTDAPLQVWFEQPRAGLEGPKLLKLCKEGWLVIIPR